MKTARVLVLLPLILFTLTWRKAGPRALPRSADTERLIDELSKVCEPGYGYSTMFSGLQFLPFHGSEQVHTLVLGSPGPHRSPVLEAIVRNGVFAIPSLLAHLDDERKTRLSPLQGMMWISFGDEYDFNERTRGGCPAGVNRDTFSENHPRSHEITIGDLCFVALGQIVNRNFSASRYQPTGGLIVSSPTYSRRLRNAVKRDFADLTEKKHRQLLASDFLYPDHEGRRIGAYCRIALYYPAEVDGLVLPQLAVPTFDASAIWDFVRDSLYRERSKAKRAELFDRFIQKRGRAFSDGVLRQLFQDLGTQEADEEGRLHPPLKDKCNARTILIEVFGYHRTVKSTDVPYVASWAETERARFISSLTHDHSRRIDEAVHQLFASAKEDDDLALACINRLIGRGYDDEIKRRCESRMRTSQDKADEFRLILGKLNHVMEREGARN